MFNRKKVLLIFALVVVLLISTVVAISAATGAVAMSPPITVVELQPDDVDPDGSLAKTYTFETFEQALAHIGVNLSELQPAGEEGATKPALTSSGNAILAGPERHCVVWIEPLQPGAQKSVQSEPECYDTFAGALEAATGGSVGSDSTIQPNQVSESLLATSQGSVVIGIDYANANFGGSSITWTTEHMAGCSDGSSYSASGMPSGWNDVVSSAKSFTGCNHYYHYEHTNFGGAVLDCGGSCATMGTMDNQTSSERWTQ